MKQEGAFSLSRVKRIAFVCDAGMGSSAMGATTFRKRLEKAGLAIEVKHYAIENVLRMRISSLLMPVWKGA